MNVYLICYPRSGSHWLAYTVNELTGIAIADFPAKPFFRRGPVKGPIIHTHCHDKDFWDSFDPASDTAICLVRNYKESLVRHYSSKNKPLTLKALKTELRGTCRVPTSTLIRRPWRLLRPQSWYTTDYIGILKTFQTIAPQKRLLVYYEDLLTDFERELNRVLSFLGRFQIGFQGLDPFIQHVHDHAKNSLRWYETKHGPSQTRGKRTVFHSKHLPVDIRVALDTHLKKKFPEISERFLQRYFES